MLVVKVELHSAITGQISILGELVIANVGKVGDRKFRYQGLLFEPPNTYEYGIPLKLQEVSKRQEVLHNQRDKEGNYTPAWGLVAKMLREMGFK